MRVIAGELGGRQLKTISGLDTRPTADKVKGAIFNVLGDKVKGAKVLDLFAGTGSLGLEALSRGADSAVFVEKSISAWKVIQQNLDICPEKQYRILRMDAFTYLASLDPAIEFDLIFLDPPYRQGLVHKVINMLQVTGHLTPNGVIVAETAVEENLPDNLYPFEIRKTKEYGDTKIWYLQYDEDYPEI